MPSWADFEAAAPELAGRVRERLDAHRHKTVATVRADGAPRISGTETWVEDGELWIGSAREALKARDLRRDPALRSGFGFGRPARRPSARIRRRAATPAVSARRGVRRRGGPLHSRRGPRDDL